MESIMIAPVRERTNDARVIATAVRWLARATSERNGNAILYALKKLIPLREDTSYHHIIRCTENSVLFYYVDTMEYFRVDADGRSVHMDGTYRRRRIPV